jgi:hypothetical protein
MGWKSTIDITRDEAMRLINIKLGKASRMSDNQLADFLEELGFGDDPNLPYCGHNFNVCDEDDEAETFGHWYNNKE